MEDYKVINKKGELIGYVINSKNREEALEMAIKQKDYLYIDKCNKSLNVPFMFQNCFMDESTVNQFNK